jgi:hypothetical protein
MKRLEITDFTELVGAELIFTATVDGAIRSEHLTLESVVPYELHPRDIRAKDTSGKFRSAPFSLFFESREIDMLPQRIYSVVHPAFTEPLALFITPIGQRDSGPGFIYESVFS